MAVRYGFFNSVNGDRLYNADDMSHYFKGLVSDGVYENVGDKLIVTAGTGMKVVVGTGRALIDCRWVENDSPLEITLNAADENNARTDYIVVVLNLNGGSRSITIYATDTLPTVTDYVKYLVLAEVKVNAGVTSIAQINISDKRGTSRCPYVTGLIRQVDTSQLFAQWQTAMEEKYAEFELWFTHLTQELLVDTYIEKYQNSYLTTSSMSTYQVGIADYKPRKDILFVYLDGVTLVEGVDYTIYGGNNGFPDMNGDGIFDDTDLDIIHDAFGNISVGLPSGLTAEQERKLDVNNDGFINGDDMVWILLFKDALDSELYENSAAGWVQFLTDHDLYNIVIDPTGSPYRAGSRITFVVLKSRIGSSTDQGILNRLATIVDVE